MKQDRSYTTLLLTVVAVMTVIMMWSVLSGTSQKNNNVDQTLSTKLATIEDYTQKLEKELGALRAKLSYTVSSAAHGQQGVTLGDNRQSTSLQSSNSLSAEDRLQQKATEEFAAEIYKIDPMFNEWRTHLHDKLLCAYERQMLFYHYHIRKSAGTTIRDAMKYTLNKLHTPYLETEGMSFNREYLDYSHVFTVTSLRNPITRILSLYWYEHVGWYHGLLKQTHKCKTLREWISAWRDSGAYKQNYLQKNPGNNYIEIENYYVKAFSGWDGKHAVDDHDYEQAKHTLMRFDLVLISEWMGDETQIDAFNAIFTGRHSVGAGAKVRGNHKMMEQLRPTLAADEEQIKQELMAMNHWDLKLYEYIQSLQALRLKHVIPIVQEVKRGAQHITVEGVHGGGHFRQLASLDGSSSKKMMCAGYEQEIKSFTKKYSHEFGIFRPAGHKGP